MLMEVMAGEAGGEAKAATGEDEMGRLRDVDKVLISTAADRPDDSHVELLLLFFKRVNQRGTEAVMGEA